jgi:hypothetical protein
MFKKINLYYYIIIKSYAPLNKGMYCTKKFYILIIIRGFTSNIFKTRLNSGTKASPKYFHIGDRKENIIHCQMRNDASNINLHLQQHHLSDYYYIIIKSYAPLNKGMYCTKKFYILIIIRGFTSIKNGLNSKFYVKFIKGINKLLPMNII